MPEIGPMMRALELQRLIEDKVAEWRERSARVAGATVAESYQQPLNFKRHTHRRKNHTEINKIIAKYSKPTKRADEPYSYARNTPHYTPQRPPRPKKVLSNLKVLSKSEDNLATVGTMEIHPEPKSKSREYFTLSKYNTKSCEDVTAFVDIHHHVKSKNFEENSILNSKPVVQTRRRKLHSICEGVIDTPELSDSGIQSDIREKSFTTSTPISHRKSSPAGGSVSEFVFEKVSKKPNSASELRKGSSEPNILSADQDSGSSVNTKTLDFRKRWKMLKPPFKKGAFDCLLLWRTKKPTPAESKPRFPKSRGIIDAWVKAIKRPNWEPNIRSFVCSIHFKSSSISETKKGLRKLIQGAVPELYLEDNLRTPGTQVLSASVSEDITPGPVSVSEKITQPSPVSGSALEEFIATPNDTPRKLKLKRRLKHVQEIAKRRRLRCNALYNQRNRWKKKIQSLKEMLSELREKLMINQEHSDILEMCGAPAAELFKRLCHKGKSYSPQLRAFALTLHFYSPKAYDYVRDTFNTCLPHHSTIRKWYSSVDASPGFTQEAFRVLREKTRNSDHKIICSLVFDEMHIRKIEEYDGIRTHGYVDYGAELQGNINELATQALVFVLVAINDSWKIPVAYFFVSGLSAEQKANLVKMCLISSQEADIEVVSITCDGHPSNISMAKTLGCSFDADNFKTSFVHPSTGNDVVIFLDPCHMVKLVRNTLESKQVFLDDEGRQIKWSHFADLQNIQEEESFHFANKLTSRHILFKDQKMKVKLAVQLFSLSVAKAIEFCDKELHILNFQNCEGTVRFTLLMNNLFDILNSHKFPGIDFKQPIDENNKSKYFSFLDEAFQYLHNLTTVDDNKLIYSRNKVGFLGLCICITSMKALYLNLIEKENKIRFLPMYKFSQDHVELLFSAIRSHSGFNNNPSAMHFKAIYKKLLIHMELRKTNKGNCFPLENINLLHCSSSIDNINLTTKGYRSQIDETSHMTDSQFISDCDDGLAILSETFLSEAAKQVISYIAGYVVRYLLNTITCLECQNALISRNNSISHNFIVLKDRGGLIYPSNDVIDICIHTEKVIKKTIKPKKNVNLTGISVVIETMKLFLGKDIFTSLHEHIFLQPPCSNHLVHLIRAVVQKYVDIRLKYLIRKCNIKETKRQVLNKLTLFKGQ